MKTRTKKLLPILGILAICPFLMNSDCDDGKQVSLSGAQQVSVIFQIPKNSRGNTTEQQNVIDRLKVTTDPTKILWIHLIALDGKIIRRMPVRCKVTSSGKRLEPTQAAPSSTGYPSVLGNGTSYNTTELIGPDGTFGPSDAYIYWFDTYGRYNQYGTAGGIGYLLTDYPIDLRNPIDEITGLYNIQEAALKWQKTQEAELVKQEAANKGK
jgi:hypothetical protein